MSLTSASNQPISAQSTMTQVLEVYLGAQRALFKRYHIGGCSSCAFQPNETLEQLCARNGNLNVEEMIEHLRRAPLEACCCRKR